MATQTEDNVDTSSEETQESQVPDLLNMSDEDFLNASPEELLAAPAPVQEEEETTDDEETEEEEEETSETEETSEEVEDSETTEETDIDQETEEETSETDDNEEESDIDYKAMYEQVFKPFKANGREISVDTPEEAIKLMQMGANYNQKMAGLKPNLKIIKMLNNNELLDESKINFLIDLDKKNPEAIIKLIKDSGIDPLDLNTEEATEYVPNTYSVSDKEVRLDETLDKIRGTESYSKTVSIVSNDWDNSSKEVVSDSPEILEVINDHVSKGWYDQIMDRVEKQKLLGNLTGLSDLEAYNQVGIEMNKEGAFASPSQGKKEVPSVLKKKGSVKKPTTGAEDPKLNQRRKAASTSKKTTKKDTKQAINPLALSDKDFEEFMADKY